MPYSFTEIEKNKTRAVGFVFSFLIFFYFLVIFVIALAVKNYFSLSVYSHGYSQFKTFFWLSFSQTLIVFGVAAAVGYAHWLYSVGSVVPKMLKLLGAEPLNEKDSYHLMLKNIIEEVKAATGGKEMEGMVIPTAAMNAFALIDFEGKAIIGVTEGLLSRLPRAQIEAVVGHEAAHIVSGDCLETTVTSSLFALYDSSLNGISKVLRGENRFSSRGTGGGSGAVAFLLFLYVLLSVTKFMSLLARMFISREREFKADAIAVRLTRDPLSLAEALYAIAYHWRGSGISGEELEAIFIVNPNFSELDERNGLGADLFSTHPPVEERLKILLDMAHADVKALEENFRKNKNKPKEMLPEIFEPIPAQNPAAPALNNSIPSQNGEWMICNQGQWLGPFNCSQMGTLSWLGPETWVKRKEGQVTPAYDDPVINEFLENRNTGNSSSGDQIPGGAVTCPRCRLSLSEVSYEGVLILQCSHCKGTLVEEKDVHRIIIREDMGFPERISRVARLIENNSSRPGQKSAEVKSAPLYVCPHCPDPKPKMLRMFYTLAYPVLIDKCHLCGFIWFDSDELEILQCLIENRTKEK